MKKGSILQEDKTVLHVYVPDNRTSKYERQKLIGWQGELDESTIVVGGFCSPLSALDRSSRQKIRQDTVELNSTIDQLDII